MHDFDWFQERLEIAKWNDESPGQRDFHAACPVHGGSDSLHVTEKNGKAMVHCFSCSAGYTQVVEALDAAPEDGETITPAPSVTIKRVSKGTRGKSAKAAAAADTETGGSTPPRLHQDDPLMWAAEHCGITLEELLDLALPLGESRDAVVFEFATARKLRVIGEDRKKTFAWSGTGKPHLWPMPVAPSPVIVITEGEFDAICLRHSGTEAYSITGGTSTEVPLAVWEALRDAGVEEVQIAFDLDNEGRKARDKALETARHAGLRARPVRPQGIEPLQGETDARDVALRLGYPIVLVDDATEDGAVPLWDVKAAEHVDLLLGWLHPQEHTILYGDGGTGKGVIAAQWAVDLAQLGMRVLIVDYEQHARHEWRPRVGKFCNEDPDILGRIYYVQPVAPIWDLAGWLKSEAERVEADYLMIDSITYAVSGMEPEKSSTAVRYTQAANAIGYPILSLGHVTKADADPRHPFGSVYWHNGARVTISVARRDADVPDSDRIVKHRKANQGQHSADMAVNWSWLTSDIPTRLSFTTAWGTPKQAYETILAQSGKAPTIDELREITGKDISDDNYRVIKNRARGVSVIRTSSRSAAQEGEPEV